jgi:hypothetical protein
MVLHHLCRQVTSHNSNTITILYKQKAIQHKNLLTTMKILVLSGLLVRFAVVDFVLNVNVNVEAFAFKSSSRVLPLSVIDRVSSTNFHRYHHLGDLEHDALPGKVGDNDMYSYNYNYNNECEDSSAAVVVFDTVEVALDDTAREAAMKFVLAMWLALAFVLGGELFQPRHAFAFDSASAFSGSATTMVLSGGSSVKDSDIVDFSMPSYETAARAEVNSNLKGDNYLLGEASKNYDGGSVESSG